MTKTGMRRTTIVAWYGEKSDSILHYIETVQDLLHQLLGSNFEPRAREEIHATIVGLEHSNSTASTASLLELLYMLRTEFEGGVPVQFGGYSKSMDKLRSRGLLLYDRTVWHQGCQCVTIGWPVMNGLPTMLLDKLRRECGRYGFPHKYHKQSGDTDPDIYMVVGGIKDVERMGGKEIAERLNDARESISQKATRVVIRAADISLIRYEDTSLPFSSSMVSPIESFDDAAKLRKFLQSE